MQVVAIVGLLLGLVIDPLVGWALGRSKDRVTAGFWLGLLLGFIGWIIVGVMEPSQRELGRREHNQAWAIAEAMAQERSFAARQQATAPADSSVATLHSMAELREKGVISDAEFEAAKRKLLNRM